MDHDASPAAAGAMPMGNLVLPPAFVEDPAGYLTRIASARPSRQGISMLAGAIAKWFVGAAPKSVMDAAMANGDGTALAALHPAVHVASHYLRAAAVQLQDSTSAAGNMEQEMIKTKSQYEVLEALGAAATLCTNRTAIASTGILPTLAHLMLHSQSAADAAASSAASARPSLSSVDDGFSSSSSFYPPLQQAGVEFLQCAILAEQYRYAARFVEGTWPRPTKTVNIRTVLRYYYLRGLVHLGCGDYVMAHRCWWTCLSVPAEGCSTIMVAAWKKLSLVQPLLNRSRGASNLFHNKSSANTGSTRFPRSMTKAMGRLLSVGRENKDEAVLLYTQIGPAVEKGSIELVKTLIDSHESLLKADGNYGLAQQCFKQAQQNLVWETSELFSVVSVTQLARRWAITPEQVPQRLLESKVPCRLEDDGMVVFGLEDSNASESRPSDGSHSGLPQPNSRPPVDASWADLSQWMQLLERLQQLDTYITTSPKYHALTKKDEKGGSRDAGESSVMELLPRAVQDL
jgi:hypothetical protein